MFKWFSKNVKMKPPQSLQEMNVRSITFLCEQDGDIERELKALWANYLKTDIQVTFACLARVRYEGSLAHNVALCLRAEGADRRALAERIGSDFRRLFKTTVSLDIIYLSEEQNRKLLLVAKPFYEQPAHRV